MEAEAVEFPPLPSANLAALRVGTCALPRTRPPAVTADHSPSYLTARHHARPLDVLLVAVPCRRACRRAFSLSPCLVAVTS